MRSHLHVRHRYRSYRHLLAQLMSPEPNCLMRFDREDRAGKPKAVQATKLSVGTKLVRDWHGVGHSVSVTDDGFEYDGKQWKSLTAIAREITGTKWSGPRFFALNYRGAKA